MHKPNEPPIKINYLMLLLPQLGWKRQKEEDTLFFVSPRALSES